MELRRIPGPHTGATGRIPYARLADDAPVTEHETLLDPHTPWTNPVVWFLAALRIGPHYRLGYTGGDPQHGPSAVSLSNPDGSRSEITLAPGADGRRLVRERGPVRLWAHVEHAHRVWQAARQPAWPRLGLTVTPTTQTVFADEPDNTLANLTLSACTANR
jgi:hypothetical protein